MTVSTNQIYNEDCNALMDRMAPDSVDLIITDPPFGIDFKSNLRIYNRKQENVLKGYAEVPQADYLQFSQDWIKRAKRVLKDTGAMYVVSGTTNLLDILLALKQNDLKIINHIIWHYNFGVYTKNKYVTSHYHILYVAKNPKEVRLNTFTRYSEDQIKLGYADRQDVWLINREFWRNCKKNSTNLPRELVQKMIEYSSKEGDLVFDPFAGSGQVPFVAKELGRNYLASELMSDVYEFAKQRVDFGEYFIRQISVEETFL